MDDSQVEELLQVLRELKALRELELRDKLGDIRQEVFGDSKQKREAFRLLYLGRSYRQIGDKVGVSHATVARWVEQWRDHGLVRPNSKQCVVSPETLGISQ